MVAGFAEVAERRDSSGCGGLQPSELFSPAFQLPNGSHNRLGAGLSSEEFFHDSMTTVQK